jgi:hypothetical protein
MHQVCRALFVEWFGRERSENGRFSRDLSQQFLAKFVSRESSRNNYLRSERAARAIASAVIARIPCEESVSLGNEKLESPEIVASTRISYENTYSRAHKVQTQQYLKPISGSDWLRAD